MNCDSHPLLWLALAAWSLCHWLVAAALVTHLLVWPPIDAPNYSSILWLAIQSAARFYDKRSAQLLLFSLDCDNRYDQLLSTVTCVGCFNQLLLVTLPYGSWSNYISMTVASNSSSDRYLAKTPINCSFLCIALRSATRYCGLRWLFQSATCYCGMS